MSDLMQTLWDGMLGALVSSLITVAVAVYAVRKTQQVDLATRREEFSLRSAETLTAALLRAGQRLAALGDEDAKVSCAARAAAVRTLADDVMLAADLHAPMLTPPTLAELPENVRRALTGFVDALLTRERDVMRRERFDPDDPTPEYARDPGSRQISRELAAFLQGAVGALTDYRRGDEVRLPALPRYPSGRE
jgi:deoxyribodipyrimidine photolyase